MSTVDIGQKCKKIVEYLWDPEPRNDDSPAEPIWCLGRRYSIPEPIERSDLRNQSFPPNQPPSPSQEALEYSSKPPSQADSHDFRNLSWPAAFLDDFESRIWITYRSNFPAIPKSKDPNAQQALTFSVRLRSQLLDTRGFTTDTGWGCMIRSGQSLLANALLIQKLGRDWRRGSETGKEIALLSLFADRPQAPFSIHRFVEHGAAACGKHPGEWFGPSATARCIDECEHAGLNVYVTSDGSDVHEDKFRQIAGLDDIKPTLILLGVRLGIDSITPVYWDALKAIIQYPQSVGIAGRLHIKEMDPSMLIGFLIKNNDDWHDWKHRVRSAPGKPIIHVFDGGPPNFGRHFEREGAVDEVEALDDDDELHLPTPIKDRPSS
ncbi:conserved hypothetical protein [Uncinocarpus reesii 1704]|uniref:Cysteine protease n=1 Tax=Uncinocarpus reesii (strain UAMH 1704) TaxID=336963 RepID=C4JWP9_UNCRE|nr:uncharacterized protein UREG_06991 [Uncinocarpus reesii 1704]EEP82126.1 conserved hypothetical protein [Uncinocarpus reesii 1704]